MATTYQEVLIPIFCPNCCRTNYYINVKDVNTRKETKQLVDGIFNPCCRISIKGFIQPSSYMSHTNTTLIKNTNSKISTNIPLETPINKGRLIQYTLER